jgi:hypothetical protein
MVATGTGQAVQTAAGPRMRTPPVARDGGAGPLTCIAETIDMQARAARRDRMPEEQLRQPSREHSYPRRNAPGRRRFAPAGRCGRTAPLKHVATKP